LCDDDQPAADDYFADVDYQSDDFHYAYCDFFVARGAWGSFIYDDVR
jgi:hypothetical protein